MTAKSARYVLLLCSLVAMSALLLWLLTLALGAIRGPLLGSPPVILALASLAVFINRDRRKAESIVLKGWLVYLLIVVFAAGAGVVYAFVRVVNDFLP